MLLFCDESWKTNGDGKRVGTLAAVAIPREVYNELEDRVFFLAEKYWGFQNARNREIKGKQLLSHYEYAREARGEVSMKLAFARELLEELRTREIKVFASVVYRESEVDLLCEEGEQLDRPYLFLMERVHAYVVERGPGVRGSLTFDDRGLGQNCRVAEAYRNFLTRSKMGRSFAGLTRTPFFAYSSYSTGIQLADVVCTVVNRFHTERAASPKIGILYGIVRQLEWVAAAETAEGYMLHGIKVLGG
jgi:hypothetical protein